MKSAGYVVEAHDLLALAYHNRETGLVYLRGEMTELRAHIADVVVQQQQARQEQQMRDEDERREREQHLQELSIKIALAAKRDSRRLGYDGLFARSLRQLVLWYEFLQWRGCVSAI